MFIPIHRIGLPLLLCLTASLGAAQTPAAPSGRPSTAASAPAAAAASGPATTRADYASAFSGYRPYGDQPLTPWREANDRVRSIGGWQAYAREAQGEPAGATPPDRPDGIAASASAPAAARTQAPAQAPTQAPARPDHSRHKSP